MIQSKTPRASIGEGFIHPSRNMGKYLARSISQSSRSVLKDVLWLWPPFERQMLVLFINKFQPASFIFRLDLFFVISLSNLTCYSTRKFCSLSSSETKGSLPMSASLSVRFVFHMTRTWILDKILVQILLLDYTVQSLFNCWILALPYN